MDVKRAIPLRGTDFLWVNMLVLTEDDLRAVLTIREVITALEEGFRALASGDVRSPERLRLEIPEADAVLLEMPAYAAVLPALGTKIVTVFPTNAARGLEIVQSVYLLLNCETGVPLALMDGRFLTAIRTSATSAVATKFMAPPGPKRLGIFGAGVQAEFHIAAMAEIAEVVSVLISARNNLKAERLADRVRLFHHVPADLAPADETASGSNLICTCTSSPTPLFDGRAIKPGTHINAVGAFTAATRELDTETVARGRVVVDAESAAGREAGDILIPIAEGAFAASHIKGSLADVVSGNVMGRQTETEITVFKSCGLAMEDVVTARLAYNKALAGGLGTQIAL